MMINWLAENRKVKIKKMSESVLMFFDERGSIKVAYKFGVVDEFYTTVGKCCLVEEGVGKNIYFRRIGW